MSSIIAIDKNLEIIVDENMTLLAYRHDPPENMQVMVINNGQWRVFNEEIISSELLAEVKNLIVGLRYDVSLK